MASGQPLGGAQAGGQATEELGVSCVNNQETRPSSDLQRGGAMRAVKCQLPYCQL